VRLSAAAARMGINETVIALEFVDIVANLGCGPSIHRSVDPEGEHGSWLRTA